MILGNTPTKEVSFAVEANKSFAFGMTFQTLDELPANLTGCTIRLVAVEPAHLGGTEVLNKTAVVTTPANGYAQFNLQATDLALDPNSYAYDVTLVWLYGYSLPIIKGFLEVGSNNDFDTSNVYTTVTVGSDVTVTLDRGDVVKVVVERRA